MRQINTIVIHHSATSMNLDTQKSLNSFNNTHKARFYDAYPKNKKQVMSNTKYPYIAYHYCIDRKGAIYKTRQHEDIGYHAGEWNMNVHSLGVLLIGNFDTETPTEEQLKSCKSLCGELQRKENIERIIGHRHVVTYKSCPGNNVSDDYIYSLLKQKEINTTTMKDEHTKWAIEKGICSDSNWQKAPSKYETVVMMHRADKPTTAKEEIIKHGSSLLVNLVAIAGLTAIIHFTASIALESSAMLATGAVVALEAGDKSTLQSLTKQFIGLFKKK